MQHWIGIDRGGGLVRPAEPRHAVPIRRGTTTAVCGARIVVRRDDWSSEAGPRCPDCATLLAQGRTT